MKFLALLFVLFSSLAYTCTCSYPPFEEQLAQATYVFAGRVLKIEPGGQNRLLVQFKILKSYKGVAAKEIEIRTEERSASCGYPFELQSEYLVYATGKEQPEVSLCSRSKILRLANEDLDLLEERLKSDKKATPTELTASSKVTADKPVNQKQDIPKTLTVETVVIVGITKMPDGYVALLRGTDKKVHFLRVGNQLHDGTVLAITDNAVTFRQLKGPESVVVKKQLHFAEDPDTE